MGDIILIPEVFKVNRRNEAFAIFCINARSVSYRDMICHTSDLNLHENNMSI